MDPLVDFDQGPPFSGGLSMEAPTPPLDTPEVFGGLNWPK